MVIKVLQKKLRTGFFVLTFFSISLFSISFADNVSKLPFKIDLTSDDITFINSLDATTFQKVLDAANQVLQSAISEKKKQLQQQTITPVQNSQTGLTPLLPSSSFGGGIGGLGGSGGAGGMSGMGGMGGMGSGVMGGNSGMAGILSGMQQGARQQQLQQQLQQQASLDQQQKTQTQSDQGQINTELARNTPNGTCPTQDGVTWVGSTGCPRSVGPDPTMKATLIDACQKNKKPVLAQAIFRESACNLRAEGAPNSNHTRGQAIDMWFRVSGNPNSLDQKEAIVLLQTFKAHGFRGYRCYAKSGINYVHLSISNTERGQGGGQCPPEIKLSGYDRR